MQIIADVDPVLVFFGEKAAHFTISDIGEVSLNDEQFDSANSNDLPQLKATLMRLKQNADAAKTPAVVTIVSDEQAKYSRTIDVLDALAVAKIDNVTFTVNEEE